ncbi:gastrula zinc finger protein xFG20-1-like [Trichogramma pretiosum]|uniref:gastrula zinc finger protein xFG20-1-like n=1 Tax=Trichogramma pretiosum TaxID=7493 RepID=UPI0006C9A0BC|nr:gastrula zinc finger protein xFG20-1-like [Trichogramma pretiosum]
MESSDILNCAVRVKEEPSEMSLIDNNNEMTDEKPDIKNFPLSPFQQENSTHGLRKCDKNYKSELDDGVEIVVECEDVKPNFDLLAVEKIDVYYPDRLRNVQDNGYKIENKIEIEAVSEVKQELLGEATEGSNLNFSCEYAEQNKKTKIINKFKNENRLQTHFATEPNDKTRNLLSDKSRLDRPAKSFHSTVDSVRNGTKPICNICGKTFSTKGNLNIHINSMHNAVTFTCDICGKKFSTKGGLGIHIDSIHNGITSACDICGKKFSTKSNLIVHINAMHNGNKHTCDICGKKITTKSNLRAHINAMHNGITHACDICGKNFSNRGNLNKHIDSGGKSFSLKSHLRAHIKAIHNDITRT